ncbi:uncharacterized protein LOC118384908 [Oncorhynchus keta]|uniref:uncharacterized protein LOC118384908 n=1 Tax=Oncorhynchus keta TaxID=8018 RepID=UPI00227C45E1|nr:uncharacterized protein LOC118384908 [Oncorhynchus keta]
MVNPISQRRRVGEFFIVNIDPVQTILSCLSLSPSVNSIHPFYQGSIRMVSAGLQMLGTALAIIGWLGSIIICALPMWKVTAFIGANIITAQTIWEGLWMNCVTQSTGQMQCKVYDSMLALPQDLQAARALIIIAIIAGVFAILLGIAGGKCTNFVDDESSKAKVAIASGVVFLIAALLVLVPVCWSANTIIRDFYNPLLVEAQRRELGASLYIGWGSAGLMILGGALLCCSCPPKDENLNVKYSKAASSVAGSSKAYVYQVDLLLAVVEPAPPHVEMYPLSQVDLHWQWWNQHLHTWRCIHSVKWTYYWQWWNQHLHTWRCIHSVKWTYYWQWWNQHLHTWRCIHSVKWTYYWQWWNQHLHTWRCIHSVKWTYYWQWWNQHLHMWRCIHSVKWTYYWQWWNQHLHTWRCIHSVKWTYYWQWWNQHLHTWRCIHSVKWTYYWQWWNQHLHTWRCIHSVKWTYYWQWWNQHLHTWRCIHSVKWTYYWQWWNQHLHTWRCIHSVNCLLDCFEFSDRHTSENLAEELLRVAREWQVYGKVVCCVSDNAANITKAMKMFKWTHHPCPAHTINLIVRDALKVMKQTVDKVKAAVEYFHRSTTTTSKQRERQCVLSSAPSNMVSLGIQMLGSALSLLGWVGVILTCILPMWRVTAFIGATIITSQTIWEGIWMSCVVESTGQMQCKPYDSLLALSSDLQAARALTVLAIATGTAGLLLAFVGGKCTRFLDEQGGGVKERVAVTAGAVLIATGVLCLIPTSWAAGAVVQGFYSSATDAQRREIGACLYIGWGASILLILGGGLFISSSCPLRAHDEDKSPSVRYLVVRSSNGAASSQAAASQHSRGPSTKSQANGKMAFTRSHSSQAASAKSQPWGVVKTRPPWEEYGLGMVEQDYMPGSGGSKAPSTKSQLKRLESQESLADKSQPNEDESLNPTKTYL